MSVWQRKDHLDKRARPVWYYSFWHRGQRYRKGGFLTKGRASAAEAKRKHDVIIEGKVFRGKGNKSLAEIFSEYLEYRACDCAASTIAGEKTRRPPLLGFFSKIPMTSIAVSDVQKYVEDRKRKGMANRTVNLELITLRNLFKFAMQREYAFQNPAKEVKNLKEVLRDRPVPNPEQMRALLETGKAEGTQVYCWMALMAYTGMRPSESFHLSWDDVDFERNQILVRPKDGHNLKTGRFRAVNILPELHPILLSWKIEWEQVFADGKPHNWVFFHPRRPAFRAHGYPKHFKRAVKNAGLKGFTPYTFRHYFCSRAIESGSNIEAVKIVVGHTPSSTVLQKHYAHLCQPFIDAEVAKIKIV